MAYGFAVEITGDYALFSRPELKVERVSYDCITPSAARGVLEAIFWKPAIRYKIDCIHVINPIQFTNIRRNEVTEVISANNVRSALRGSGKDLYMVTKHSIAQRASLLLKDVRYIVEFHFELTDSAGEGDTPEKFYNMILRRLQKGQCFHMPYLGCREFPAKVSLWEGDIPISAYAGQEKDMGLMLYDMEYKAENIEPVFFRALLQDGRLRLANCEVFQ